MCIAKGYLYSSTFIIQATLGHCITVGVLFCQPQPIICYFSNDISWALYRLKHAEQDCLRWHH